MTGTLIAAENGVVWSEVDGEVVLLAPASGAMYRLNSVASSIWHSVLSPTTVDALRHMLATEYDVDVDVCQQDLMVLLRELSQRRLIRVVMSATPSASP